MENTVYKNTGNSRTLASVPNFLTLYPTYEDFVQALISRTLPIDLGPLNPAGVKTLGDNLDKETLLKDATAALYGLPATAVPDDVLVKARELITAAQTAANAKAVIYTGSYTGTGTVGPAHPNQITFPAAPKLVLMPRFLMIDLNQTHNITAFIAVNMADLTTDYVNGIGLGLGISTTGNYYGPSAKKSSNGRTLYWYSHTASDTVASSASYQGNEKNKVYHWIAFA